MTGEKRTETRMRCYNTLCIPYISLHPSLHALYMTVGRVVEHLILVSVLFSPVIPISYQNYLQNVCIIIIIIIIIIIFRSL